MTTISEFIEVINRELARFGTGKKIKMELSERMFYKVIKFLQQMLKDKENEPYRNIESSPKWKRFEVDINDKHFIFTKGR